MASHRKEPQALSSDKPGPQALETYDEWSVSPPDMMALEEALARLDAEARDLVSLHVVGGFTIADLAQLSGLSRPTVRRYLGDALRRASLPAGAFRARSREDRADADDVGQHDSRMLTEDVHIDMFEDVIVGVWRGNSPAEAQLHVKRLFETTQHTALSYLGLFEPTSRVPDAKSRRMLSEIMAIAGSRLRGAAIVMEGSVARRTAPPVFNAAMFLSRSSLNVRFFSQRDSACAWLAPYCLVDEEVLQEHLRRLQIGFADRVGAR